MRHPFSKPYNARFLRELGKYVNVPLVTQGNKARPWNNPKTPPQNVWPNEVRLVRHGQRDGQHVNLYPWMKITLTYKIMSSNTLCLKYLAKSFLPLFRPVVFARNYITSRQQQSRIRLSNTAPGTDYYDISKGYLCEWEILPYQAWLHLSLSNSV